MPEVKSPEILTSRPPESVGSPTNLRDVSQYPILPLPSLENTLKGAPVSPNRDLPKALEPGHPSLVNKPFEPSEGDVARQVEKMRQQEEASRRLSLIEGDATLGEDNGSDVERRFREARETGRLGEGIEVRVDPSEGLRVIHVRDSSGNEARMVEGQRGNRASWGDDMVGDPDELSVPAAGVPAGPPPGNRPPAPPSPDNPEPRRAGEGGGPPRGPEDIFNPEFKDDGRNWALEYTRRAAEINGIEDPIERERRGEEFLGYIRALDRMAASDKFFGVGIETMRIEKKLVDFDARAIEAIPAVVNRAGGVVTAEARRIEFESLLEELDALEYKKKALQEALEDFKDEDIPELPMSERGEYDRRKADLAVKERELLALERQVTDMRGDPNFITERRKIKAGIDKELRDLTKNQEAASSSELKDEEPSELERDLEAFLLTDRPPEIDIKTPDQVISYAELKKLKDGDKVTIKGTEGAPDQEVTARELKDWYFYTARTFGFLDSVNSQLTAAFVDERAKIADPNNPRPEGAATRFLREASEDNINLHENDFSWEMSVYRLETSGGMNEDQARDYVNHFKGIKGDFLRRGGRQAGIVIELFGAIRDETDSNKKIALQSDLNGLLQRFRDTRLSGEFNVAKVEEDLQKRGEVSIDRVEERPYTYRWNQYELTGNNREGVERSAEAAVNDLLAGSAAYDVNAMIQRMTAISEAIQIRGDLVIEPTANESKEEQIKYLQKNIANRISFHLGEFFGAMVQMDSYAGIMQKWAGEDGYERLRVIPTMIGGLAGKAIELRYRPEYKLSLRPEGWSGQLYKNQLTQRYIRGNLEELMIDDLMRYELRGETEAERYKTRMALQGRMTQEKFDRSFVITEHPRSVMQKSKKEYTDFLKANEASARANPTWETLNTLKRLRKEYNAARKKYVDKRAEAKAAVEFSKKVMDSFLESAKIGAPSIRMHNEMVDGKPKKIDINGREVQIKGDDMSVEDITSILEYVVMQEAKKIGQGLRDKGYDFDDNGAFIRWRSRMFLDAAMKDGDLDKRLRFNVKNRDGQVVTLTPANAPDLLTLQKGFEYTGLTKKEFKKLVETFEALKKDGYKARIEFGQGGPDSTKTIPEILKEMKELAPVLNHYLAADIYGSDIFLHKRLNKEANRGTQSFVANLRSRLGWFGLDNVVSKISSLDVSGQREEMGQVLENSRSFHDTITEMVYYLGTRKDTHQVLDERFYINQTYNTSLPDEEHRHHHQFGVKGIYVDLTDFDAKDMVFGFPNITLGHKRIKYLNANWILRNQEKVARGIKLLPFVRIMVPSLSEDLGGKDILEVIWNMDKEYFDQPWMMGWGGRMKNAVDFRSIAETSIGDDHKTKWGFLDKWLSDIEQVWALFDDYLHGGEELEGKRRIGYKTRESMVGTMESVFSRFTPLLNVIDKSLSYDREAAGSGAADEANLKILLRMLGWLIDAKPEDKDSRQRAGGAYAHGDGIAFINFVLESNSYRRKGPGLARLARWNDKSVISRVWEKIKPRTPNISSDAPVPPSIAA